MAIKGGLEGEEEEEEGEEKNILGEVIPREAGLVALTSPQTQVHSTWPCPPGPGICTDSV